MKLNIIIDFMKVKSWLTSLFFMRHPGVVLFHWAKPKRFQ